MELDQEILNEMAAGDNDAVKESTFVAAEKNPDQHAKVMSLAEKFGAQSDFVEQNYESLRKENERNEIEKKVNLASPKLKQFISNPDYAAVSKDDLDVLKNIEDTHDQYNFANQALASVGVGTASIMSGITKLPALGANIALKNVNDFRDLFGAQKLPYVSYKNEYGDFWDEAVHNYAAAAPTASESWLEESFSKGNHARAGEIFALQFIQNAPQTVGLLAAALSGVGIPALLAVGGITASNKAAELEKEGTPLEKSTQVGVINGGIEAAFESLGTFAPLKQWEKAITKEFGKQSGKEFIFNFGKTLAHSMGTNFSEEAATSLAQDFTDYASGVNPDAMKGSISRSIEAGGLGMATGGMLVTPAGISAGLVKRSQIKQAEINQKIYDSIGKGTLESKLAERSPDIHAQYLKGVFKDGPIEKIYMNPEGFSQYFQSKNINPNDMASELGITESFNDSIETGADLVIPTEVVAQKLAKTEHFEGLKEHVKFGPDELSAFEVKMQDAQDKRDVEIQNENARAGKTPEEISTAEESGKEVFKNVAGQLKALGYSPKEVKHQAKLHEQFFVNEGLRRGQMPMDVFNKYGLTIQNVETESSVSENIDTTEYFQASPQSKKLGIKFSATKVNNKISVNPLNTVSVTAELVESGAGRTAVVDNLKTDAKYPGVSLDAIKSLEYAAARNGATSMSISAKRLNLKLNDKVIQNYADAGFTMVSKDGDAIFVKKLDPVVTYNQATISPIGFYSQVEAEINKMDFTQMPAKDLMNRIKNIQGLKKEELEYIGLDDFLAAKDGKVTKDEVLAFVKENGVQVEQVVLGSSAGEAGTGLNISEAVFIPLSDYDQYYFNDAVDSEMENIRYELRQGQNDSFNDNFYPKFLEENKEDYTDEDGNVDEEQAKQDAIEKYLDKEEEYYRDHVDTEDYYDAHYKITERNSGETLIGNSERGWYSDTLQKSYDDNEEEAKIKWIQDLIDGGHIESDISEAVSEKDIEWASPSGEMPADTTLKRKARDLLKTDKDRIEKLVLEENAWIFDEADPSDKAKYLKEYSEYQARKEVDSTYTDPNNKKNQVTVKIDNAYPDGFIKGNNINGWQFQYEDKESEIQSVELKSKDLEAAKAEAVSHLASEGVISKAKKSGDDVNAVTGKSKWKKYTALDSDNYREVLLTLPKNKGGSFSYTTHFEQKNFVAHARLSDTEIDGKKTLFIEEIQSDWHQQGRESGYKSENSPEKIKDIEAKVDELNDKLRQQEKDYTEFKAKVRDEAIETHGETDVAKHYSDLLDGKYSAEFEVHNKEIEKTEKELTELNEQRNGLKKGVSDAPFKQTDAWASLVMKRMIRLAAEQGYEKVAWTPAAVHQDRWGTDNVSWVKIPESYRATFKDPETAKLDAKKRDPLAKKRFSKKDLDEFMSHGARKETLDVHLEPAHWLVGSAEQRGGNADGVNIEELARQRGELLERSGEKVQTKDELKNVIASTLGREKNDRSLDSLTDRVWKQMESGDQQSGAIEPRAEGMAFFYDKMIPDVTKKILKKLDPESKVQTSEVPELKEFGGKALSFDITSKIKDTALNEGFQLFQENRGSITFGKNRQFNINLFKSKDESTFLHETGHFFLEVMADGAELDTATDQTKQDYQTMLKWLGVNSRAEIKAEHHEKFARGFEKYLYSGKAPSEELRKAFHAFRQWLIAVYQNVLKLNVDVSPEMTAVFDRMLASDEQIDIAIEKIGAKNLFDDPTKVGMTEKETYEYLNAVTFARMDARDQLQAELMKDIIRRKDSAYKNRYKAIYKEEMEIAEQMPELKAIAAITGEFKLQKDVIENQYEVFKKTLPNKSTIEVGFHPDFVAGLFGFENGQAMLQATAPYRRGIVDHVESQTVTRIKAEFPELLESPELTDEAIKAAHTAKYRRLKRMEMEYLFKNDPKVVKNVGAKLIRRMPSEKAVKQQAIKIVAATKVKDLKPHLFRSAEKKYSVEAAKAFKSGEFGLAFEAKRKEYLNFELYKAAVDAQDDVKKSVKNYKKIFRSDEKVSETRDVDLVNAARAILAEFGIMKSEKTAEQYLASMKEYDPESYTVVNGLVQAAIENKGPYQDIPYEDFVEMNEAVQAIYDLAKTRKQIEIDGEKKDIDQVISELSTQVQSITPAEQKAYEQTVTKWGLTKEKLLGAKASLVRAEHWAKAMDVKDNGVFFRYIFRPISDAVTKYRLKKNEVLKKYESILRAFEKNITPQTVAAPELLSKEGKPFLFKNKAELLMALLHSGNESNLRKLLVGRGWGSLNDDGTLNRSAWDKFISRMQSEKVLVKSDYDFAQSIWDLMESMKPDAQKAHKQMFGYYFNEITAQKIVTPFGEYAGGYIPAKTDLHSVEDSAIRKEKEEFENNNNSFQFPTTGRGFTKSRVENYAAALSLDMNMLGTHIDGVMRFSYIEPRVKEVAKVVLNKSFRSVLGKLDSNIAKDMLVPWLQRAAQQKILLPANDGLGRMTDAGARYIRKNVAMQIMFAGVTNTLQQTTGLVVAMSKVKPKYVLNGLWNLITNNKETVDSIMTKSDWMKSNQGSNTFELHDSINKIILNPTAFEDMQQFSKRHTYFMQAFAQGQVNNAVWAGAYDQSIEKGMTERDAIKEADSVVRTTQGTNNPEDVSRFEQGTATELLFKQFVGYFNMLANLNASELVKIQRDVGLKKGAGRAFYLYLTALMIPAVLSDAIVKAMAGKLDEDDDDEYLDDIVKSFFGSQFKTIAATVPYVGQLGVAAYNKYLTDSPADDRLSLSPAISIIEATITAPIDLYLQASEGNDVRKKTVKDSLQMIGVLTGLPTGPIGKPVGYLMDVKSGAAQPTGPVDFTRGLVTGRNGK